MAKSTAVTPPVPAGLIYILAGIVALGPLSVDLYLPAMPSMVLFFDTQLSQVQLTLSSYLLGFALFHLVCGPLSDRYGRKPVLLVGLSLYVVMSAFCAMAETIEELIIFRFLQAMGACCAPTLGRAIVRDVYPPQDSVKALAYVSSLMALAPVLAPTIGGVLVRFGDWRLTFWALVVAGLAAILLTCLGVKESLPERQTLHPKNIMANFYALLSSRIYMGNVLTAACLYAGAFAFLSGASFILIDFMHVKAEFFGLYFMVIVAGYVAGNLFTAKLAYAWPVKNVFKLGIAVATIPSFLMVIFCLLQWYHPLLIVTPVLFVTMGIGLVLPQAMGLALRPFAHMAATASAMMGFLQMMVASIAGLLVGLFLTAEPLPMALVILATGLASALCYRFILSPVIDQVA
ncbi:MAG: multidrug effflux MFS transporter [Pseudomonadales bacterium]|nr:multidrug effflux MFS transporter [Pseudomonadales bacterium]